MQTQLNDQAAVSAKTRSKSNLQSPHSHLYENPIKADCPAAKSVGNRILAIGRVKNDEAKYRRDHPEHMADGTFFKRMKVGGRLRVTAAASIGLHPLAASLRC